MNGNEFLDKMELIDPAYLEAAEAAPKKMKKAARIRRFSVAACLCLAIAGTVTAYQQQNAPGEYLPVPNPDGTVRYEKVPEVWPSHPILRPGDEGYIAPVPTLPPPPEDSSALPNTNGAIEFTTPPSVEVNHGVFLPNNVTEFPDVKPHISYFGDAAYSIDYAINNGCAVLSLSLQSAMAHYGDTANYRVYIELFRDGVQISASSETAFAEAQRLGELGFTPVLETFRQTLPDGSVSETYHFSLNTAERDQLENFPASEELGYMLTLYGEHFGEDTQPDTIVFNSAQSAP